MGIMPYEFEFELARRTIVNLNNIDHQYAEQKKAGKTDAEISNVYETTQLINSFIGLLVIPRERILKNLKKHIPDSFETKEARDLFYELNREKNKRFGRYQTTYDEGRLTPWTISRHLRNAISHGNLDIQPQSIKQGESITGFIFSDKDNAGHTFELKLSIREIRLILIETANLILGQFPERFQALKLDYLDFDSAAEHERNDG